MTTVSPSSSSMSIMNPLPSSHAHRIKKLYVTPTFNGSYASGNTSYDTNPNYGNPASASHMAGGRSIAGSVTSDGLLSHDLEDLKLSNIRSRGAPNFRHKRDTMLVSTNTGSSQFSDTKGKGKADDVLPKKYYPVSYIRGQWMQQLLALDIGKRKIRYYLSDETLCLGTPLAPIASPFRSGMTFYEAYTRQGGSSSTRMYMSEEQVNWLVDELYSNLGVKNSKLVYEDVDIDRNYALPLEAFDQIRRVRFQNNVAGFRQRCGIALFISASSAKQLGKDSKLTAPTYHSQGWTGGAKFAKANLATVNKKATGGPDASIGTAGSDAVQTTAATDNTGEAGSLAFISPKTSRLEDEAVGLTAPESEAAASAPVPSTLAAPPTSFTSLTKAERQARLQARREAALQAHLHMQRAVLPAQRRLYQNVQKFGGAALACDVECWTEDADVLLELGMAWMFWVPQEDGATERDGGCCHYIIEETVQYRNEEIEATRWDYTYGQSQTLRQAEVSARLREKIDEMSKYGPLILVFHDASAETRFFQKLGVDPTNYLVVAPSELTWTHPTWPAKDSPGSIIIQDTQNLYAGWSDPQVKQINLGKACLIFGLTAEAEKLHNAGNDAFVTLRVWERLLDMEEYELQKRAVTIARPSSPQLHDASLAVAASIPPGAEVTSTEAKDNVQPAQQDFEDLIQLW